MKNSKTTYTEHELRIKKIAQQELLLNLIDHANREGIHRALIDAWIRLIGYPARNNYRGDVFEQDDIDNIMDEYNRQYSIDTQTNKHNI